MKIIVSIEININTLSGGDDFKHEAMGLVTSGFTDQRLMAALDSVQPRPVAYLQTTKGHFHILEGLNTLALVKVERDNESL